MTNTVLYDHQTFCLQRFGGISRYFCEIASEVQSQADWRAHVVAPLHFNSYLANSPAPTLGIYVPTARFPVNRLCGWISNHAAPPLMAILDADLIHQTYYPSKPYATKKPKVVTVYDMIHELFPHYFRADDRTSDSKRASVDAADHVLCISHNTAKDLIEIFGVPPAKISVTPLGYSQIFQDAGAAVSTSVPAPSMPYLLFVGWRGNYKNFARVLTAYAASALLSRNFDLIAFGGSPFSARDIAEFKSLGLRENSVRQVSGDDVVLSRYYSNARLFVYPSEYEGFGIPLLEAMSAGCPVACSSVSSMPEVAGEAAEFFDPLDVDSIRNSLEKVARDDSRRTELIRAGRARSLEFTWKKCAAGTIAAYGKVM